MKDYKKSLTKYKKGGYHKFVTVDLSGKVSFKTGSLLSYFKELADF